MAAARARGTHTADEWGTLLREVDGECPGCRRGFPKLTLDHVRPISKGGSDAIGNLQPLCESCNKSKGPKTVDYLSTWRRDLDENIPYEEFFQF